MNSRPNATFGFTLLELMVVMVVCGVLASLAVPSFTSLIKATRLRSATDSLFKALQLARSESITRNNRTIVCKSSTGKSCSFQGGWEQGWIVFVDANNNGLFDSNEPLVLQQSPLSADIRLSGNGSIANYVSFNSLGRTVSTSGAFQAGTLTACANSKGQTESRKIVISSVGRSRLESGTVDHCV